MKSFILLVLMMAGQTTFAMDLKEVPRGSLFVIAKDIVVAPARAHAYIQENIILEDIDKLNRNNPYCVVEIAEVDAELSTVVQAESSHEIMSVDYRWVYPLQTLELGETRFNLNSSALKEVRCYQSLKDGTMTVQDFYKTAGEFFQIAIPTK